MASTCSTPCRSGTAYGSWGLISATGVSSSSGQYVNTSGTTAQAATSGSSFPAGVAAAQAS
ncbi:hypothetical protein [Actinacidiphila glaucinigra]|uniref:hypothetical protein n=1 Tax=Actinacidiphila glaucinigra TaxID=235986 RepID=UPI003D8A0AD7